MVDENLVGGVHDSGHNSDMERAKQWWQKHGNYIVIGVVIGLTSVFSFNYWNQQQDKQAEQASLLFGQLNEAVEAQTQAKAQAEAQAKTQTKAQDQTKTESKTDKAQDADGEAASTDTVQAIVDTLRSDYAGTVYAIHGALALAKIAMEDNDLAQAAKSLGWANEHVDDKMLAHIVRLRLASVWLAQGEADSVIELLAVEDTAAFAARYHELTGDAYLQKDDNKAAREAYQLGVDAPTKNTTGQTLLKLKLDNLSE